MVTLAGIIVPLLCAVMLGRHMGGGLKKSGYMLICLIALVQACLVLIDMYTLPNPLE
jgi:hypothetical protein